MEILPGIPPWDRIISFQGCFGMYMAVYKYADHPGLSWKAVLWTSRFTVCQDSGFFRILRKMVGRRKIVQSLGKKFRYRCMAEGNTPWDH